MTKPGDEGVLSHQSGTTSCRADAAACVVCADLYDVLSQAFAYPTASFHARIVNGVFTDALQVALRVLGNTADLAEAYCALHQAVSSTVASKTLRHLESDYIALFDANRDAPPVHPYARLHTAPPGNPITLIRHLQDVYRTQGVELVVDEGAEQADHLTVQLEFMALLWRNLAQALEQESPQSVAAAWESIRQFQPELDWLERFVAATQARATSTFYASLAVFLLATHVSAQRYTESEAPLARSL